MAWTTCETLCASSFAIQRKNSKIFFRLPRNNYQNWPAGTVPTQAFRASLWNSRLSLLKLASWGRLGGFGGQALAGWLKVDGRLQHNRRQVWSWGRTSIGEHFFSLPPFKFYSIFPFFPLFYEVMFSLFVSVFFMPFLIVLIQLLSV